MAYPPAGRQRRAEALLQMPRPTAGRHATSCSILACSARSSSPLRGRLLSRRIQQSLQIVDKSVCSRFQLFSLYLLLYPIFCIRILDTENLPALTLSLP